MGLLKGRRQMIKARRAHNKHGRKMLMRSIRKFRQAGRRFRHGVRRTFKKTNKCFKDKACYEKFIRESGHKACLKKEACGNTIAYMMSNKWIRKHLLKCVRSKRSCVLGM